MNKYYIWGFPGIGKSKPVNSRLRIVDADCERFKFSIPEDIFNGLHSNKNITWTQRNLAYCQCFSETHGKYRVIWPK